MIRGDARFQRPSERRNMRRLMLMRAPLTRETALQIRPPS